MRSIHKTPSWTKAGVFVSALLIGALGLQGAGHASGAPAPSPSEVAVIPPGTPSPIPIDAIDDVGATGYLHNRDNNPTYLWTRFSDAQTTTVSGLIAGASARPAGADWVYRTASGSVTLIILADQSTRTLTLPAGQAAVAVNGTTVLARTTVAPFVMELLAYADDGSTTTKPITGLPAQATGCASVILRVPDTSSAILLCNGTGVGNELVDMTTGIATTIPSPRLGLWAMDHDHLVGVDSAVSKSFLVYSRSGLVSGTNTTPQSVPIPAGLSAPLVAIVGNQLIAVTGAPGVQPAVDVPLDGSAPQTLYPKSDGGGGVLGGPDGSAVVLGGNSAADFAAHWLTADGSGNLVDGGSVPVAYEIADAGISLNRGIVRHVEATTDPEGATTYTSYDRALTLYPGESAGSVNGADGLQGALPCQAGVKCIRLMAGNGHGPLYLRTPNTFGIEESGGGFGSTQSLLSWGAGATITDVSNNFAIVNSTSPTMQTVVRLEMFSDIASKSALGGAALWGSMLWQSTPATIDRVAPPVAELKNYVTGTIYGADLDAPTKPRRVVQVGAPCKPSELQADDAWIYWSCGASGPAGAHNLTTGANVSLPAGNALLGDGFVVVQTPGHGTLTLYDFVTGALADPALIGSVPVGLVSDDRQFSWTVDKNGGDVAYVDAGDNVHVVEPGITRPPATVLRTMVSNRTAPREPTTPPNSVVAMNRPIDSWTFTIKAASGPTVRTFSGGPTREFINVPWNGTAADGSFLPSGSYTWTLTTSTAEGPGVSYSGPTLVLCGAYTFRSYDCNGQPALLGVKSSGEAHWYNDTPTQKLFASGFTEEWPSSAATAFIPWGDMNNDGMGDLVVRDSAGVLWAYMGIGLSYFGLPQSSAVKLGTGWQAYTMLLTTGDVNGDVFLDMIARDKSGVLYMFPGRSANRLGAPTKIGTEWNTYKQFVGVGDITGDGKADLVAVDNNGVLWRFNGNGTGGFGARVQIGTGWSAYPTVIGIGDYNHDGHNDLIAKDNSGSLWLFPGNGTGGFTTRVGVATGYSAYKLY